MILAVFRAMILTQWRDRLVLAATFLLPPVVFLIVADEFARARSDGGALVRWAGAVSVVFAMTAAVHGALTLIEERRSGVADRILAGPWGLQPVVTGKFLFLVVQGVLQTSAVFAVAQLAFRVPVVQHLGSWLATTVLSSASAAGPALGLVAFCRTRAQAVTLGAVAIPVLAIAGGGLPPRLPSPIWLQALGWATPNAWAIDAYESILWRDADAVSVLAAWAVLAAVGLAGLRLARIAARVVR